MLQRFVQILFFLLMGLSATACVYKIPVQQGNVITDAELSQIHKGMTIQQVVDVMGEPLLKNIYNDGRLIYVYTMKTMHRHLKQRRLTIQFTNGRVSLYQFETNAGIHQADDTSKKLH